ncbi:MAG TPA: hypothetical protein VMB72_00035 [Acidimicrobiales bacterium]|nr:hypothetical protein [Acidimicrobiales bacterium]
MIRAGTAALAAGALLLGACGSPYPGATLGQQVSSWASTTGFAAGLRTLRADAGRVARLEAAHDPAALRTGCDVLVNDALAANQNLPTPDATLTATLTAAYQAAAAGGRDCLAGAGGDGTLLGRARGELAAAAADEVRAQARMDDLGATGAGGTP